MTVKIYSYYDTDGKHYDIPFFAKNDLHAKRRMYGQIKNDSLSQLALFTEKFDLYMIGSYECEGATFSNDNEIVITGKDMKVQMDSERS